MQDKTPDISCNKNAEQKNNPVKIKSTAEIEKIKSIRNTLYEIEKKEEEEEIRKRITDNVKLFKDKKENPEKYEREERIRRLMDEKKNQPVNISAPKAQKSKGKNQNRTNQGKKKRRKKKSASGGIIFRKGDNAGEIMRKSVFWLSVCVFSGCIVWLGTELYNRYDTQQQYDDISNKYGSKASTETTVQTDAESAIDIVNTEEAATEEETYNMIPGAKNLLEISPDVVGFISVPGTVINYPVMQNKDDTEGEEFFLQHDFYGNESHLGSIYLDFRCDFDVVGDNGRLSVPTSDNLIIYGHDMRDGSMFGSLRNYANQDEYYQEHPIIEINSNYKEYTFKIYGYFIADAVDTSDTRFDYWNYINFQNEADFYGYVNEVKRRTIRLTDVDVEYGDRLLTLSTCSSVISNGRLVVCARMVREGEDIYEGTRNSKPNHNIKWPTIHWDSSSYDPNAEFVPYG